MFDHSSDWMYPLCDKLCEHAREVADQLGDSSLRQLAQQTRDKVHNTNYDSDRAKALNELYNSLKSKDNVQLQ